MAEIDGCRVENESAAGVIFCYRCKFHQLFWLSGQISTAELVVFFTDFSTKHTICYSLFYAIFKMRYLSGYVLLRNDYLIVNFVSL